MTEAGPEAGRVYDRSFLLSPDKRIDDVIPCRLQIIRRLAANRGRAAINYS